MASGNKAKTRFNAAARKRFLDRLSETANVAGSERAAGMAKGAAYAERRKSAAFRADWAGALAEGYARLEAELLSDALLAANGKTEEAKLKERAQKNRQGINLLNWHRGSVKAATPAAPRLMSGDLPVLKAQLILKLTAMRERAGIPLEGLDQDGLGQDNAPPPEKDAA